MEENITYEKEDWMKFQGFLERELPRRNKVIKSGFFVNLIAWTLIGIVAMFVFRQIDHFHWPTAGFVSAIAVIIIIQFIRDVNKLKHAFAPSKSGCFIGSHSFVLTESGIESRGSDYSSFHAWSAVREIVRDNGIIMLFLDTAYAYIFPEHKLDDPDVLYNYVKECNKQLSTDSGADAPPPAS